ncbi:MAG TPA: amidohydrolase family protein [Candidatus Polarisedimenticolaceae bacterium]|nr:amidohydrolase family protein [Candidatus Polarisedimenticolaceae bacterium]
MIPALLAAAVLVRDATIWTQGPQGKLEHADLLVQDGKVVKVGAGLTAPSGAVVVDGKGKHVTPGLIDCHSHTAIRGGVNEGSNNVTAEVRIDDVLDPRDVALYRELAGGLTAAHSLHGSANSIGGQDAIIKLHYNSSRDRLLVPGAPKGIKFALGENPKQSNFRDSARPVRYPQTRMGVMDSIAAAFTAARHYREEWQAYDKLAAKDKERREPPRRDLQLEAIAEILDGKRKIHSHCYRQDEILALIRTCEAFGVKVGTFQHVLEGYKVADEIAAHGAGGSTFSDWWAYKLEAWDAIPYNGALMREHGIVVSFNSDSDELARRLNLEAAKAMKYGGVPEIDALDFVTLNPAKQLGIDDRTGSLEPGKDGDFVVWSGPPLSVYSVAEQTWVDGVKEFDRAQDLVDREAREKRRADAIATIRGNASPAAAKETAAEPPKQVPAAVPPAWKDRLGPTTSTVSIVHATIHTVSGPTIEDGTVSFRAGKIVEVGAKLAPLAGARVVDATGRHVYPGFIDANTALGLTEIGSVAGSVDIAETGSLNPQANTAIAVNPDSELIPVTRVNGVTHVLAAPDGGLVSGTSALIRLSGWTWEDLQAASPVALHIQWPSFTPRRERFGGTPPPSEEDQKKERDEAIKKIHGLFDDARAYAKAKDAKGAGGRALEPDPALEAVLPVLDGRAPVIVQASEIRQIKSAIAWAESEGVRMILLGAGDVARVATLLHDKHVPVIVDGVLALPRREDEPYDAAYTVPARLAAAGVEFCITGGGGGFGAWNTRNLPYHAAMAAAFGLAKDDALKAITLSPAKILGVDHALGSIETGKSASLVVTDGDPLEIATHVLQEWIDGQPVDVKDTKHVRLYEKYRSRPAVTARAGS